MTTENIVQDTEESRIAQQKRDTLHRLLCILAESSDSASGFLSIEVKDVAKRVDEAYDQLGNNLPEPAEELKAGTPTVLIALPAGAGMSLTPEQASFNLPEGISTGQISDGYHTFDELYAHRVRLFTCLMHAHKSRAWWSFKHHDGSVWDGWIIAGIDTPAGSATYHLPESAVDDLPLGTNIPRGKEWDGHTAADVLERLKSL
ncbi:hypothetical protein [Klebsiella phage vB_KpnP_ZX1]|nr:hypothetical protein [Klebsiella phage vB_KpnP_ZX1]